MGFSPTHLKKYAQVKLGENLPPKLAEEIKIFELPPPRKQHHPLQTTTKSSFLPKRKSHLLTDGKGTHTITIVEKKGKHHLLRFSQVLTGVNKKNHGKSMGRTVYFTYTLAVTFLMVNSSVHVSFVPWILCTYDTKPPKHPQVHYFFWGKSHPKLAKNYLLYMCIHQGWFPSKMGTVMEK